MAKRGRKSAAELEISAFVAETSNNRDRSGGFQQDPPDHLTAATQAWWSGIVDTFRLEHHHLRTLQAAAESWDRYQQARQSLAEHGLTYEDSKGMIRARPECAIERDSRIAYIRAMRELGLDKDVAPPKDHNARGVYGYGWRDLAKERDI